MAPEEPTSAPVTINAEFCNVNPMPAAAQPEYELSIEMTTGMSAPPIGMMIRTPDEETEGGHCPEQFGRLLQREIGQERNSDDSEQQIEPVLAGKHDGVPRNQPLQLGEGNDRSREGDRADRGAQSHFDAARQEDGTSRVGDTVCLRIVQGGAGDKDRRHSDKTVKCGDQLGHRRHLDPQGHGHADETADRERRENPIVGCDLGIDHRGQDGDRHSGDTVEITGPRRLGRR